MDPLPVPQGVEGVPAVRIDDREAALTMMRHVMALGHRRIGFIKGDPKLSASERRLEGYRMALDEVGMTVVRR